MQRDWVTYSTWNEGSVGLTALASNDLPPRSVLYAFPIHAVGTPLAESLTSYLVRQAEAFAVPLQVLVQEIVGPRLEKRLLVRSNHVASFLRSSGHTLDGKDETARQFSQVLAALTCRRELAQSTFLPWARDLASLDLIRKRRAWCPRCWSEWRAEGQPIYEPLLWRVAVVTICPVHGFPLQQICPFPDCRRSAPVLVSNMSPGRCPFCGRWQGYPYSAVGSQQERAPSDPLGAWDDRDESGIRRARAVCQEPAAQEDDAWALWAAREVGELLATASGIPSALCGLMGDEGSTADCSADQQVMTVDMPEAPEQTPLAAALRQITERYGRVHAVAQVTGLPDSTILRWRDGAIPPTLRQLLVVAHRLDLPLRALVEGNAERIEQAICQRPVTQTRGRRSSQVKAPSTYTRRERHPFDAAAVERALRAAVACDDPPPSLRAVGQRLEYSNAYLRRYFPELCDAIVTRWKAYRATQRQQRLSRCIQEVERVVGELRAEELYPSAVRILVRSHEPLRLTEQECAQVWKSLLEPYWNAASNEARGVCNSTGRIPVQRSRIN